MSALVRRAVLPAELSAALAAQSADLASPAVGKGSKLLGFMQRLSGGVARFAEDRLLDTVSVFDFMTAAQVADVKAGSLAVDVTAAIQLAVNTKRKVFFPAGAYRISSTIFVAAHGQILQGEGASTFAAAPGCSFVWYGSGGTMVSFGGASPGYSNGALKDIRLNGNNLANVGVDASNGYATYRITLEKVYVEFVNSGTNATGIAMGLGAFPGFSNDVVLRDCYVGGCTIGISGAGSTYQLNNTTVLGVSGSTGIKATAGAFFSLVNCVLSAGAVQIDATSPQMINAVGCWFENSTVAVYKATTSHTLALSGCFLHTFSSSCLMDTGNAAGAFAVLGCFVPSGSASRLIANVNGTSDYSTVGSNVLIASGYKQRVQGYTRSDQGSFAAGLTSDASNTTGDGTLYSLNAVPWVKDFDRQTAFDASTGVFTAQLFGDYVFSGQLSLGGLSAAMFDIQVNLVAGGQSYLLFRGNPGAARSGSNELVIQGVRTVYMTPGQTAYLAVVITGGAKVVTIASGGPSVNWRTRFEGRMV